MDSLEEQAEKLIRDYAAKNGKTLRELGVLDTRRLQVVRRREVPMTVLKDDLWKNHKGDS